MKEIETTRSLYPLLGFWSLVFGLNLIVPLGLGWSICGPFGKAGLIAAVGCYWGLGLVGLKEDRRWGRALIAGGVPVAFSQFWPLVQLLAGTFAISAWNRLSTTPNLNAPMRGGFGLSGLGGFVVTGLTGGMLMTVAFVIGSILVHFFDPPIAKKPAPIFTDEL